MCFISVLVAPATSSKFNKPLTADFPGFHPHYCLCVLVSMTSQSVSCAVLVLKMPLVCKHFIICATSNIFSCKAADDDGALVSKRASILQKIVFSVGEIIIKCYHNEDQVLYQISPIVYNKTILKTIYFLRRYN
jgi:hypothetical protein